MRNPTNPSQPFDKVTEIFLLFALILSLWPFTTTTLGFQEQLAPAVQHENAPSVDQISDRTKVHDEWQERYLLEYRAQRNFHAANLRFEEDATLEVRTTFRRPYTIESQVLRAEGSSLIRERVFDNILKAENETHSKLAKHQVDIVPANYSFSYIGGSFLMVGGAVRAASGNSSYRSNVIGCRYSLQLIRSTNTP
jgi:hypothetical protein